MLLTLEVFLFILPSIFGNYLTLSTSNYPPLVNCDKGAIMSSKTDVIFTGLEIDLVLSRLGYTNTDFEINCINETEYETFLEQTQYSGYFSHETYKIEQMEKNFSYSVSIFDTGLSVLALGKEDSISFRFLTIFDVGLWIIIVLASLLIAHLIWLIEKSNKGDIQNDYVQGINNSLWTVVTAYFFANDIKIKTFAGRIIYAVFLFMILVLKTVFLAEFISDYNRRSLTSLYSDITSYGASDNIGTFQDYKDIVRIFNGENSVRINTYSKEDLYKIFQDLENGNLDGIVMDAYLNLYMELQSKCSFRTIGNIFYYFSYPIIFSKDVDSKFINELNIEILNLKLSIENEILINKYIYSNATNCLFKTNSFDAINFDYIFGIFMIFIIFFAFSLITLGIKKYYENKNRISNFKHMISLKSQQYINKNNSNKDMNMLLKFDKILSTSEKKFKQRLKDLEAVIQQNTNSFISFKEILEEIEKTLVDSSKSKIQTSENN